MSTTRRTALGSLVLLALLCLPRHAGAVTMLPFQSTETGTYLLTVTSATTSHAAAVGTGSGSFGSFQSSGSQDSDFTDPLHQVVSNGHFTQDYGAGPRSSARSAAPPRPPVPPAVPSPSPSRSPEAPAA